MKNCGNCIYKDLSIKENPCRVCRYNEYFEEDKVTIEVIEIHKFASPDDVADLDFPGTSREDK